MMKPDRRDYHRIVLLCTGLGARTKSSCLELVELVSVYCKEDHEKTQWISKQTYLESLHWHLLWEHFFFLMCFWLESLEPSWRPRWERPVDWISKMTYQEQIWMGTVDVFGMFWGSSWDFRQFIPKVRCSSLWHYGSFASERPISVPCLFCGSRHRRNGHPRRDER